MSVPHHVSISIRIYRDVCCPEFDVAAFRINGLDRTSVNDVAAAGVDFCQEAIDRRAATRCINGSGGVSIPRLIHCDARNPFHIGPKREVSGIHCSCAVGVDLGYKHAVSQTLGGAFDRWLVKPSRSADVGVACVIRCDVGHAPCRIGGVNDPTSIRIDFCDPAIVPQYIRVARLVHRDTDNTLARPPAQVAGIHKRRTARVDLGDKHIDASYGEYRLNGFICREVDGVGAAGDVGVAGGVNRDFWLDS